MGDQFYFSSKLGVIGRMLDDWDSKLGVIGRMLDDWDVSRNTKEEVIEKYNKFWEKKYGNKVMPLSFHNLPKSFRGEVSSGTVREQSYAVIFS
ncbi:hypothetical protein QE152_g34227 [Popillia japonica]|uniref:Uncharacterized protein n=1 Tax=Popillia japonica TaxID=7064 RepID=A0AAW1IUP3_POPJA